LKLSKKGGFSNKYIAKEIGVHPSTISRELKRNSSLIYPKISIPTTKRAEDIEKETLGLLTPFKDLTQTITSDNGLEFSNHESISKALECDYYFCHPYSSWERGLNEYTNGLIRQYILKGSSFTGITQKGIQEIEDKINHRPRKNLGWKTPYEVFYGLEMVA